MGLIESMIGGAAGAEMFQVVQGMVAKQGGVQGIVDKFEQNGLGSVAKSWVGTGANQPVSPDQINQTLGSDTIKAMAAKAGITPEALAAKLSTVLPAVVDKLTPNGKVS